MQRQNLEKADEGLSQSVETLEISEQRYREVYEAAPLTFVVWDNDWLVTDWNRHAEKVFGWSRDKVLGKNIFNLIIPASERTAVKNVVGSILQGKPCGRVINGNITKEEPHLTVEHRIGQNMESFARQTRPF